MVGRLYVLSGYLIFCAVSFWFVWRWITTF